jgi:putative nucleotidyltransferase with HDIG domain
MEPRRPSSGVASRRAASPGLVLGSTFLVVVVPAAASWLLVATGSVSDVWVSAAVACACSAGLYELGGRCWQRARGSNDVLACELLAWGWIRRRAIDRRLADAAAMFSQPELAAGPVTNWLDRSPRAMLRRLAFDLETTDPFTHGHSQRVARYASLIARQMGCSQAEIRRLRLAALLHDIGKLHTPRSILDKPVRLTEAELAVIKQHSADGAAMIASLIDDPELCAVVRHHHERIDGTGYPDGRSGVEIPLGARIIAVADTFDAITSRRAYRNARPHKLAMDILQKESGTQLDPAAVRAFRDAYFGRPRVWLSTIALNGCGRLVASLASQLAATAALSAGAAAVGAAVVAPARPAPRVSAQRSTGAGRLDVALERSSATEATVSSPGGVAIPPPPGRLGLAAHTRPTAAGHPRSGSSGGGARAGSSPATATPTTPAGTPSTPTSAPATAGAGPTATVAVGTAPAITTPLGTITAPLPISATVTAAVPAVTTPPAPTVSTPSLGAAVGSAAGAVTGALSPPGGSGG